MEPQICRKKLRTTETVNIKDTFLNLKKYKTVGCLKQKIITMYCGIMTSVKATSRAQIGREDRIILLFLVQFMKWYKII